MGIILRWHAKPTSFSQLCTIPPCYLFSTSSYGWTLSCFHSPALTKLLQRTSCLCVCEGSGQVSRSGVSGSGQRPFLPQSGGPSHVDGCSDWPPRTPPTGCLFSCLFPSHGCYLSYKCPRESPCLHHGWVNAVFSIVCVLRMAFKFLKEWENNQKNSS